LTLENISNFSWKSGVFSGASKLHGPQTASQLDEILRMMPVSQSSHCNSGISRFNGTAFY